MGTRGPVPTPSAILNARGSWRGKKNKTEPAPPVGAPPCPDWLSVPAAEVWQQMVAVMEPLGVLTSVDGSALARYCDAFVRWKKVAAFLAEKGEVYALKDAEGVVRCMMPFPQVAIYKSLTGLLMKLEQEFGLTPASRSRVHVQGQEEKPSPKRRFFDPKSAAASIGVPPGKRVGNPAVAGKINPGGTAQPA
jgi:P27 family predicted phage terminase small subunit